MQSPSVTHDFCWCGHLVAQLSFRVLGPKGCSLVRRAAELMAGKQASEARRPFDASWPERLPLAGWCRLLCYVWWSTWLRTVPIIRSVGMMWVVQLPVMDCTTMVVRHVIPIWTAKSQWPAIILSLLTFKNRHKFNQKTQTPRSTKRCVL